MFYYHYYIFNFRKECGVKKIFERWMKDLTEAKIAIFVNTRINIRNFHAEYWLATTIQTINPRPDFSRTFRNIYIHNIFPRVQIFFYVVYLYTLTRLHRMASPCNRHIANNHQIENISSTFDKSAQSADDLVTMQKYELKKKMTRRKREEEKMKKRSKR